MQPKLCSVAFYTFDGFAACQSQRPFLKFYPGFLKNGQPGPCPFSKISGLYFLGLREYGFFLVQTAYF
jgi:hypothetical protein